MPEARIDATAAPDPNSMKILDEAVVAPAGAATGAASGPGAAIAGVAGDGTATCRTGASFPKAG